MGKYGFCSRFRNVAPCAGRFPRIETVNSNTNTSIDNIDPIDAIAPIIDVSTASYDGRICPRVEAAIDRIIDLVGDEQFVRRDQWGPDDGYEGFTPGGQSNQTISVSELMTWLEYDIYHHLGGRECKVVNGLWFYYSFDADGRQRIYKDNNQRVDSDAIVAILAKVTCAISLVKLVNECLVDPDECTLYTAAHWAEMERQKMRKECEAAASELMHKHGLERIDTIETIKAIHADLDASEEAYEAHMDPEARLHRYGMHKGSGSDSYWEDEDHATFDHVRDSDDLHRLLTYMRLYFPLLWSEWQATQDK